MRQFLRLILITTSLSNSLVILQSFSALIAVSKARAANKGINNLRIKKKVVIPSNLDQLSVFVNLNPEPQVLLSAPVGAFIKNPPPVRS